MKLTIEEVIYDDHNNSFTVEYSLGASFYPINLVTRVTFELNGKLVDSAVNAAYFDFSVGTDGRIIFKLGKAGYVAADSGKAKVVVYDPANVDGVILSGEGGPTSLSVTVK